MSKQPVAQAVNDDKPDKSLVAMPSNKRLEFFEKWAPQISMVLPQGSDLNAARIVSLAVQLTSDYKIANCEPKSIVGALMQSVILGFEPIPGLGLAAFIAYGGKLHFQIEYKGYVDLLHRTKLYDYIYAEVVREGDEFEYELGTNPHIKHVPKSFKNEMTHTYAVAKLRDSSFPIFRVVPKEEVYQIRDHFSQAYRQKKLDSPWFGVRKPEMWKKTAILQLQKQLPKSITMAKAVATDEKEISIDDYDKESKELDFAKYEMVTDDKPVKSEPEQPPETPKPKKDTTAPEKEKEPEKTSDGFGTEEEVVKAAESIAKPEDVGMTRCIRCGEVYDPTDLEEANKHLKCTEKDPDFEVEEPGVEVNDPYPDQNKDTNTRNTPIKEESDLPLNKAVSQVDANRKIKYLREKFAAAGEKMVIAGYANIGAFCTAFNVSAITTSDITEKTYEAMKAKISEIIKK